MLAEGRLLTEMSDRGIRVSDVLVTGLEGRDGKAARLLLAQGNTTTKQPEFHRVTTQRTACQFDLSAFDKAQRHQAQYLRIRRVNRCDGAFLSPFQGCERFAVSIHNYRFLSWFR